MCSTPGPKGWWFAEGVRVISRTVAPAAASALTIWLIRTPEPLWFGNDSNATNATRSPPSAVEGVTDAFTAPRCPGHDSEATLWRPEAGYSIV